MPTVRLLGLLFSILCTGCSAGQIILGRHREVVDAKGAREQIVRVNGRSVECWIARSPAAPSQEPKAFVLYFVGRGDRADRWINAVAGAWEHRPVEVWGMNYPGSGGSTGPPNLRQVGPDAVAVFDAIQKIAGPRPVFLEGGSFGSAVALCVAAQRPVAGVVVQNPPPLRQLILQTNGWWNLWLLAGPVALGIPKDLDSIENASRAKAPAIFILAEADEVVPPRFHEMVLNAYADPKRVIRMPGARHDTPLTRETAAELAANRDWLWSLSQLK